MFYVEREQISSVRLLNKYRFGSWIGRNLTSPSQTRPHLIIICFFRHDSVNGRKSIGEAGQAAVKIVSTEALYTCAFVFCSEKTKRVTESMDPFLYDGEEAISQKELEVTSLFNDTTFANHPQALQLANRA